MLELTASDTEDNNLNGLSARETGVLRLLRRGLSNKQIAQTLFIPKAQSKSMRDRY
ncbi:MAG: LuxR C-terminal-related transcriptional regulator [bacterium]